jgi:hypothetical protein
VDSLQDLPLEGAKGNRVSKLNDLLADIKTEFPSFKLVRKEDSLFMKVLGVVTFPFCPSFMQRFGTTIGKTVYYPPKWSDQTLYEVLRHERVHIRDSDKWGLLYYLTYLLLPLPFVVSGRAYWEFRGYCETLKADWETQGKQMAGNEPLIRERDLNWVIGQFMGPSYFFMFPFRQTLDKAFRKAALKWV